MGAGPAAAWIPDEGPVWLNPDAASRLGVDPAVPHAPAPTAADGPRTPWRPATLALWPEGAAPQGVGLAALASRCGPTRGGSAVAESPWGGFVVWCAGADPRPIEALPPTASGVRQSGDPELPFVGVAAGGVVWSDQTRHVAEVLDGGDGETWWTGRPPAAAAWLQAEGTPLVAIRRTRTGATVDAGGGDAVLRALAWGHERPLRTAAPSPVTEVEWGGLTRPGRLEFAARDRGVARAACDAGVADGCAVLGWLEEAGAPPGGVEHYRRACTLGSGSGCRLPGDRLAAGVLGSPDPSGARDAWEKGCALGDGPACSAIVYALLQDGADYATEPRLGPLLTGACLGGAPDGCPNLLEWAVIHGDFAWAWVASQGGDLRDRELFVVTGVFRLRWCATRACADRLEQALASWDGPAAFDWGTYRPTLETLPDGPVHAAVVDAVVARDVGALHAALDALVRPTAGVVAVDRDRDRVVEGPRIVRWSRDTPPEERCVLHVEADPAGRPRSVRAHLCGPEAAARAEAAAATLRWAPVLGDDGVPVATSFWTWPPGPAVDAAPR